MAPAAGRAAASGQKPRQDTGLVAFGQIPFSVGGRDGAPGRAGGGQRAETHARRRVGGFRTNPFFCGRARWRPRPGGRRPADRNPGKTPRLWLSDKSLFLWEGAMAPPAGPAAASGPKPRQDAGFVAFGQMPFSGGGRDGARGRSGGRCRETERHGQGAARAPWRGERSGWTV